jgi:hypothetical protein
MDAPLGWGRLRRAALLLGLGVALFARAAAPGVPWENGQSRGEDLHVFLYTFGPGDDVPSYFGHSALVLMDERLRQARLYNYGMFSFDNAMLLKFIKGRLEFWVGEDDPFATLRFYRWLNRDITIQELNLSPDARLRLAKALAENVRPENRNYLYNHYFDNCSTRPRDLIDLVVGGQLKRSTSVPGRFTLREHTRRYGAAGPLVNEAMDFLINDLVDRPLSQAGEGFLPDEVMNQLARLTYVNEQGQTVPYVKDTQVYNKANRPPTPEKPPNYNVAMAGIGVAFGLLPWVWLGFSRRRPKVARVGLGFSFALLGFVVGFPGTVAAFVWFTNHVIAHHDENLFLASPFALWSVVLGVRLARGKNPEAPAVKRLALLWAGLLGLALLGAMLKLLPWFDQKNAPFFCLFLPLLAGAASAAWRYRTTTYRDCP